MNQTNRRLRSLKACYSFKGNDFCCESDRRHVKKVTNRARRAVDKMAVQETSHA